ncbi:hypothetical protein FOZ63_023889, partial [Perkinsus olseni]
QQQQQQQQQLSTPASLPAPPRPSGLLLPKEVDKSLAAYLWKEEPKSHAPPPPTTVSGSPQTPPSSSRSPGLSPRSDRLSLPGPALGGVPPSPANPSSMRHLHLRGSGNPSSPSADHVLTPRSAMTPRAATGRASTIS